MTDPQGLLNRLDEIGRALEHSGQALALIALGSVGLETNRLDAFSDLDFFAIVEDGAKSRYIDRLDWLEEPCPLAYTFRNTVDGYKILYQDGIYGEFAVFELPELEHIPYAPGRVVWKRPEISAEIATPVVISAPPRPLDVDYQLGEALTNLYVGLCRHRRGEKLSGARFVQNYAVDRILELAPSLHTAAPANKDNFSNERRFEQRFPELARELPGFVQGYDHNCASALAILAFLERHFAVNAAMAAAIRALCAE